MAIMTNIKHIENWAGLKGEEWQLAQFLEAGTAKLLRASGGKDVPGLC